MWGRSDISFDLYKTDPLSPQVSVFWSKPIVTGFDKRFFFSYSNVWPTWGQSEPDLENKISLSLSQTGHLWNVWRKSLKVFLRYGVHKCGPRRYGWPSGIKMVVGCINECLGLRQQSWIALFNRWRLGVDLGWTQHHQYPLTKNVQWGFLFWSAHKSRKLLVSGQDTFCCSSIKINKNI